MIATLRKSIKLAKAYRIPSKSGGSGNGHSGRRRGGSGGGNGNGGNGNGSNGNGHLQLTPTSQPNGQPATHATHATPCAAELELLARRWEHLKQQAKAAYAE